MRFRIKSGMTARGEDVSLGMEVNITDTVRGHAYTRLGWARGPGRRAGKRPQGTAKGLTLTERRLSFAFAEGTPRPEGQALRRPREGPMEAALILRFLLIKEKEGKASRRHRYTCLPSSV